MVKDGASCNDSQHHYSPVTSINFVNINKIILINLLFTKHTNTKLSLVGPLEIFLNFHIIYERFCKMSLDWPPDTDSVFVVCTSTGV